MAAARGGVRFKDVPGPGRHLNEPGNGRDTGAARGLSNYGDAVPRHPCSRWGGLTRVTLPPGWGPLVDCGAAVFARAGGRRDQDPHFGPGHGGLPQAMKAASGAVGAGPQIASQVSAAATPGGQCAVTRACSGLACEVASSESEQSGSLSAARIEITT